VSAPDPTTGAPAGGAAPRPDPGAAEAAPGAGEFTPSQRESADFLLRLAHTLHVNGAPSHRLEDAVNAVAPQMGLRCEFLSTPTFLLVAIGELSHQRTYMRRVEPGRWDLARLTLLDSLIAQVGRGAIEPQAASERLDAITAMAPLYSPALRLLAGAVSPAAIARLFGGGGREMLLAGLAGLAIGLMGRSFASHPQRLRVLEPLAAFVTVAIGVLGALWFPPVSTFAVTTAGIILLVPGFTATIALLELANGHLVGGTARLAGAVMTALALAAGTVAGFILFQKLGLPVDGQAAAALPSWTSWVALVISPVAIGILFGALPRDLPWIVAVGVLAFGSARFFEGRIGPELAAFGAALVAGLASNLYARTLERPAAVPLVPSLLILIPGSLAVRSATSFFTRDYAAGATAAVSFVLAALGLAVGVLFANILLRPRRAF
jgi:uncharacterized membrane protein YjjP (DUF1212 family)